MTNRFLEVQEIQDLAGEEQLKYFCIDEEEAEEDKEKDKGGRADA